MGLVTLTNPSRYEYVVRRWNAVTRSFGPRTFLSDPSAESFVNNRSVYEDDGGNISVVFSSNRADAPAKPCNTARRSTGALPGSRSARCL